MPEQTATSAIHEHETRWYRQFWPWFLIILPGIVVVASLVTVYIAFKGADNLVAKDYYKEGLAINKTVDDLQAAKDMQLLATLDFSGHVLKISLESLATLEDQTLSLKLQHPFDDHKDVVITLNKTATNEFSAAIPELEKSKWYITLQSTSVTRPWRLTSPVHLPQSRVVLRPE